MAFPNLAKSTPETLKFSGTEILNLFAAKSAAAERDWANLPRELVAIIAKKLSVADNIRFGAVCSSWLSAASPDNTLSLQKKPYLLLRSEKENENGSYHRCAVLDVFSGCCHRIDPLVEIREKWCVGSQFGWIMTVDKFSNPSLLNPFTRSLHHLPPIASLSQVVEPIYDGSHSGYRYLASHNTEYHDLTLEKFRYRAIRKLVLSSSPTTGDFSALGIFDGMKSRLIYIRPGDKTWSLIDDINDIFDDILFYKGNFLVVSNEGDVYAFDLCGPIVQWNLLARGYGLTCFSMRYLVESSGFLMQVCRERDYNEGEIMSRTIHIEVMKLDPKPRTWIPVINLQDQSLFLGTCCSMSVSAADALGLKENCVYFTDDDWHYAYSPPKGEEDFEMIPDVGVYNMTDGSVEIIHIPDERFNWLPPIWVTPSAS